MATNQTYSASFTYRYLTLHLTISSTENVSANTSTVTYRMFLRKPEAGGAYNFTNSNYVKLVIGNNKVSIEKPNWGPINITGQPAGYEITLESGTVTIPHDADGSGSVSYSATFIQTQVSNTNATISGVHALTKIPRASSISVSPSSGSIGDTLTFNMSRAMSSYTHTLRWKAGSSSYQQIASGVGTSYAWTIPQAVAEAATTGTTVTVECQTYNGSTLIGSKTTSFTINVPSDWVPTINSIIVADGNGYLSDYGTFIQSLSTFAVTINAAGSHGSTIASYSTVITDIGTYSGSPFTTAAIGQSGTFTFNVTVTDTRGRTATASTTATVHPYSSPNISASVYRADPDGTQDDMGGEYLRILTNITWQDDITGNNLEVKYRYKLQSSSTWGSYTVISGNDVLVSGFPVSNKYDVEIVATDNFRSTPATFKINDAEFPIDILYSSENGPGIAFGKPATKHRTFDCAWPAIFPNHSPFERHDNEPDYVGSGGIALQYYYGVRQESGVYYAYYTIRLSWIFLQFRVSANNNTLTFRTKYGNNAWGEWKTV